jgi:putative ABC transport system permease protein
MSQWLKLVARNTMRHRLRTLLTLAGVAVAILAFGVLQTIVETWYAGVDGAVPSRLITRNAISLTFPLPQIYSERIRSVEGVRSVTYMNWFGGIYKDKKNFFPQYAIDAESYLNVFPEIQLSQEVRRAFLRDRRGAIVGRKLADRFGLKPGDVIQLRGTIYPGNWELVIQGVFDGRDPKTETALLFFHWNYLNETLRVRNKALADQVGVYAVNVSDVNRVAEVSQSIDKKFRNSMAETITETERAFQIGFVKQTEAILMSVRIVSFVVIFIILAVMANTMAMTARERLTEYAMLKALGFDPGYVARLILGESVVIALAGGVIAITLTPLVAKHLAGLTATLFPALIVSGNTVMLQALSALAVGVIAALVPMRRSANIRIVDGLRAVG